MPLSRQSIEKRDFPLRRRGYDADAVDAHLAELAGQIEALQRYAERRADTLSATTGDQVRSILQAAEDTAAGIRAQADADAERARSDAATQARSLIDGFRQRTAGMLQRLDEMDVELEGVVARLRDDAQLISQDLAGLQRDVAELPAPAEPPMAAPDALGFEAVAEEPAPDAPAAVDAAWAENGYDEQATVAWDALPEAEPEPDPEPLLEPPELGAVPQWEEPPDQRVPPPFDAESAPPPAHEPPPRAEPAPPAHEPPPPPPPPAPLPPAAARADEEGARLVALNMALTGSTRAEIDRYLAEHLGIRDRDRLLDEVFTHVAE